ncbi:MAG: transposase family protein [Mycobacterium sp.]|nr:transposase family protein [Mycobacterium sp.]
MVQAAHSRRAPTGTAATSPQPWTRPGTRSSRPQALAWTRTLLLDGELADAGPKKLRCRLLHAAVRITRDRGRLHLRIAAAWSRRHNQATASTRVRALPRAGNLTGEPTTIRPQPKEPRSTPPTRGPPSSNRKAEANCVAEELHRRCLGRGVARRPCRTEETWLACKVGGRRGPRSSQDRQ